MDNALQNFFGFSAFREGQRAVIERVLAGDDLCVVMPTGAGKSLCYQLPALMRPGYTLVVSPLISLMKDQVDALLARGIEAAYINSTVPPAVQQQVLHNATTGSLKLLYVAPERFRMSQFRSMLEHAPPSLFVVDEAHCISQWGHDFRPDYLRLGEVVAATQIGQICAFTATATPQVRADICRSLHRPDMHVHASGFQRPNLSFSVCQCQGKAQKLDTLAGLLADPKPTIIYTSTRKAVEEVAAAFDCIAYHAGMPDQARAEAQEHFMHDSCPVLVATNAFGMGIDRADIRRVVHYSVPGSLEAYYQEAGRAGRDGNPADCILLFSYADRFVHEFLIDLANPSEHVLKEVYAALRRYAAESGSSLLELAATDIAARVSAAKNEKQVSGALGVLDKHGYITRHYRRQNLGGLRVAAADLDSLRLVHQHQGTQRSRFLFRVIEVFGKALHDGIMVDYEQLANLSGLHVEQVQRVVRALQQAEVLQWTPPFSGRAIELCRPDDATLDLDFAALAEKRRFDESRLEDMIDYTKARCCRQQFLISYFGQQVESWQCGCCDLCCQLDHALHREPSASEAPLIRATLATILEMQGRFGRGRVCQVLAGSRNQELLRWRLHELPHYGQLRNLTQSELRRLIDSLESAGCIGPTGNPDYPCVDITALGIDVLDGKASLKLNFAATALPAPPSATKAADLRPDNDLVEALRQLRARLAKEKNVQAYQILHDRSLRELAAAAPVTSAEAQRLYGIGELKARTIIPAFLEVIEQWRRQSL